jgi:histidinol-phosphate aminotransferase
MKIIDHRKTELGSIFRMPPPKKTRLNFIRLDKNERSNKHKNDFIKKLKKEISSDLISAYPEFHTIYKILAKKFKINTNNIVLTPGSDAALKNTFEIFYKKNKKVITIHPTFAMVDVYCKIFQTKQIKIGYNDKLELDLDSLNRSIDKNTCLIILANPNSPTGSLIKKKELESLLIKAKRYGVKVIIDEAYYEFSKYNYLNKIKKYDNLIIIRTFSKLFGLAGLRAGYVASNHKIIKKYFAIKPMYEINSIAVKAIELFLQTPSLIKSYLKEMRIGERYVKNFCKKNEYKFIKCYANFYHIDFNFNPDIIQKHLQHNKILVKGGPGVSSFENYLRISFSNKKTISTILKKINIFLKKSKKK